MLLVECGCAAARLIFTINHALTRAVQASRGGCQRAPRARRQQPGLEYAVFWLPRRTIACERVLQEEGVYGDVAAGELPIDFIPFDGDVLSLELDTAFRARARMGQCCTAVQNFCNSAAVVNLTSETGIVCKCSRIQGRSMPCEEVPNSELQTPLSALEMQKCRS